MGETEKPYTADEAKQNPEKENAENTASTQQPPASVVRRIARRVTESARKKSSTDAVQMENRTLRATIIDDDDDDEELSGQEVCVKHEQTLKKGTVICKNLGTYFVFKHKSKKRERVQLDRRQLDSLLNNIEMKIVDLILGLLEGRAEPRKFRSAFRKMKESLNLFFIKDIWVAASVDSYQASQQTQKVMFKRTKTGTSALPSRSRGVNLNMQGSATNRRKRLTGFCNPSYFLFVCDIFVLRANIFIYGWLHLHHQGLP